MTILSDEISEADRKLADHILVMLRGLKLSRDLDLAESAIRAERQLTEQIKEPAGNGKAVPVA